MGRTTKRRRDTGVAFDSERFLEDIGLLPPHLMLAKVAAGFDPRIGSNKVRDLVRQIGSQPPDDDEWFELRELILNDEFFAHEHVSMQVSLDALKTLIKYCYPQPRAIEVTGDIDLRAKVASLTEADMVRLQDWFRSEF